MACFMDLSRYGYNGLNQSSVIFRAGRKTNEQANVPEVLVIQDPDKEAPGQLRRTLVFKSAQGSCNPQAGTGCAKPHGSLLGDQGVLSSFTSSLEADAKDLELDAGSVDQCDSQNCVADLSAVKRGSGYVQSMISALSLLNGTGNPAAVQAGIGRKAPAFQILSIGLGAGTLPLLIHDLFPESRQTVVEFSSEVAQAAKCFGADGRAFEMVVAEGRQYMESTGDGEFDALLIDAFDGDDKVPKCLTTGEFFKMARGKLRQGGVLIMNAHSGATLHNDLRDLQPAALQVFGQVWVGQAPGLANKILVATVSKDVQMPRPGGDGGLLAQWFDAAEFEKSADGGNVLSDSAIGCR